MTDPPAKKKGRISRAEKSSAPLISAPTPAASLGPIVPPGPPPGSALSGPSREAQASGVQAAADQRSRAAQEGRDLQEALAATALADEAEEMRETPAHGQRDKKLRTNHGRSLAKV